METAKTTLDRILYWIIVVLFAFLVLTVVWQVVSRQVLNAPATWTEEAARLSFVWLGLFAAAFVFGERGHIAVEFVARKFSQGRQRILGIVVQSIVLGFAALILIWGGTTVMLNAWTQNLSALPFTLGQMYLALPVAGVLIAFYSSYYIRGQVRREIVSYPEVGLEDAGTGQAAPTRGGDVAAGSKLLDGPGPPAEDPPDRPAGDDQPGERRPGQTQPVDDPPGGDESGEGPADRGRGE